MNNEPPFYMLCQAKKEHRFHRPHCHLSPSTLHL